MSKSAVLFLIISLLLTLTLWLEPWQAAWPAAAVKVALGASGVLLLVALMVGKRVKFDPVLR
ncbi:PA3371 family protein [Pseudomonas tohonis]|uniref:PA3371 family protein n=1 Tax=Pseudomonas tohonis TaxID=2725477 RepID=UPI001F3097C1|nr:PA3371 family protein [Pseudomonas tohonis]